MSAYVRPKTPNRGAADERAAIMRKIRALLKSDKYSGNMLGYDQAVDVLNELLDWVSKRDDRNAAKPGGLGRKKKTTVKKK